jgi:glutamine synthetase
MDGKVKILYMCTGNSCRSQMAEAKMDLLIQAAFENEFYLLKTHPDSTGAAGMVLPPAPADQTLFAATLPMDMHRAVIDDIADALTAQGVAVEQYYPESGTGQQETTVRAEWDAMKDWTLEREVVFRKQPRRRRHQAFPNVAGRADRPFLFGPHATFH